MTQSDAVPPASSSAPQAILLAAGRGKRMRAQGETGAVRPKVVYEVAGEPMIRWVVRACQAAGVSRCIVVVGYEAQQVRDALADMSGCEFVTQSQQLGTGHAAQMAQPLFADQPATDVFVLAGDGPLIRADTLKAVLQTHRDQGAAATLATAIIDDPTGYGRVLRDAQGGFDRIVEQKDATDQQLLVREINPSYYCFRSDLLFSGLSQINNDNKQGEYYLTDVPALLKGQGRRVAVVDAVPAEDVLSINTPAQLGDVDAILRRRLAAGD